MGCIPLVAIAAVLMAPLFWGWGGVGMVRGLAGWLLCCWLGWQRWQLSSCVLTACLPFLCVNTQLNWLSVDFNNWKDWEDDSDEDMSNFDRFSEVWEDEFREVWVLFGWVRGQAVTDGFREFSSSAFLLLPAISPREEGPWCSADEQGSSGQEVTARGRLQLLEVVLWALGTAARCQMWNECVSRWCRSPCNFCIAAARLVKNPVAVGYHNFKLLYGVLVLFVRLHSVAFIFVKQMMNNMGGDDDVDLPEVDGADDVSTLR